MTPFRLVPVEIKDAGPRAVWRGPGGLAPHLGVIGLPPGTMLDTGCRSRRYARTPSRGGAGAAGSPAPVPDLSDVQPMLDSLTHVGQQAPQIGDLHGLGRTQIDAAGVLRRALASIPGWWRSHSAGVLAVQPGSRSSTRRG